MYIQMNTLLTSCCQSFKQLHIGGARSPLTPFQPVELGLTDVKKQQYSVWAGVAASVPCSGILCMALLLSVTKTLTQPDLLRLNVTQSSDLQEILGQPCCLAKMVHRTLKF